MFIHLKEMSGTFNIDMTNFHRNTEIRCGKNCYSLKLKCWITIFCTHINIYQKS